MDISVWLRSLGLECYEPTFRNHEIDPEDLSELNDEHLKELGIPLGHRLRLLKAIALLEDVDAPVGDQSVEAKSKQLSKDDQWKLHRLLAERIYHEDTLLAQRTYNLLTVNAFLTTGFIFAAGSREIRPLAYVIALLGLISCLVQVAYGKRQVLAIGFLRLYLSPLEKRMGMPFDSALGKFNEDGTAVTALGKMLRNPEESFKDRKLWGFRARVRHAVRQFQEWLLWSVIVLRARVILLLRKRLIYYRKKKIVRGIGYVLRKTSKALSIVTKRWLEPFSFTYVRPLNETFPWSSTLTPSVSVLLGVALPWIIAAYWVAAFAYLLYVNSWWISLLLVLCASAGLLVASTASRPVTPAGIAYPVEEPSKETKET